MYKDNTPNSANLTKTEIFEKIEIFRKFGPKSKFFENLTEIENFRKLK